MAFFKFRKTGAESDAIATQPESIEALRKRAKQRLIGASILVLVGVIVGSVLLAMYLPMFTVFEKIR